MRENFVLSGTSLLQEVCQSTIKFGIFFRIKDQDYNLIDVFIQTLGENSLNILDISIDNFIFSTDKNDLYNLFRLIKNNKYVTYACYCDKYGEVQDEK